MKVYCGDYWNYKPPKQFPWKRLGIITLCVALTTAATPAMVSYYWNGQRSVETLELVEARRLVGDPSATEAVRKSAGGKIFMSARKDIEALRIAERGSGTPARDAGLLLKKLSTYLED